MSNRPNPFLCSVEDCEQPARVRHYEDNVNTASYCAEHDPDRPGNDTPTLHSDAEVSENTEE